METVLLVKKAKKGDKEALLQLIMDKKQDFYKLAFVYMKNNEDSMDAMEDMIVILYENIHRLKNDEAFYSWSKTILVNSCKDILRKKKREIPYNEMEEEGYEECYGEMEKSISLEKHLSALSEKHQEVIRLRYFLDLDYQSIADMIKVPVGTVKSRVFTGLKKLKESFGGETL